MTHLDEGGADLSTPDGQLNNPEFQRELTDLLNIHGIDNLANVPDFILADHLVNCLLAFETAHRQVLRHANSKEVSRTTSAKSPVDLG